MSEKKESQKTPTSATEHESAGKGDPARKSANVTIDTKAYDELAKTARRMRWTVPQYVGFLAEATALKNEKERIADVWRALDTTTNVEGEDAPSIGLEEALA